MAWENSVCCIFSSPRSSATAESLAAEDSVNIESAHVSRDTNAPDTLLFHGWAPIKHHSKMSTRFYPRFVKGNPQLRIFLPDWKMVLVKAPKALPDNIVTFKVDPRMTEWDVKNYLEKIYNVQVGAIQSRILAGSLIKTAQGLAKRDDYRLVDVTLPIGKTFKWPDLFPKEQEEEEKLELERTMKALDESRPKFDANTKIPGWVSKFTKQTK